MISCNLILYFFRIEEFDNWLTLLPEFLVQRKVPYHLIKALSNVARYNLPQFTKSLYLLKPAILGMTILLVIHNHCVKFLFYFLDNVDIVANNKLEKSNGLALLKDMTYTQCDWEKEIGLVK